MRPAIIAAGKNSVTGALASIRAAIMPSASFSSMRSCSPACSWSTNGPSSR